MKILALGGSGGMGRFAVNSLIRHPQVESILVADLNESAAKRFASSLSEKTSGIGINVTDKEALERAMNDVDVVINTTGPFFKLAVPILKAAIETKTHYLDICDDWEPTEKMFLLNDKAKDAGITAIIGLGASPGITNMLGLIAMKELDQVSKVYTGWDMSSAQPAEESSQTGVNAAMVHGIEQIIGKVKVFSSAEYKMVRPLEKVTVDYPQLGTYKANIFGHPEAISFPHHYPEIKESLNLMHSNDDSLVSVLKLIRFFIEIKLLSKNMAAKILTWLEGTQSPDYEKAGVESLPSVYGYAEGIKNEKKISVAATFHTEASVDDLSMGEATAYPLSCGVKMILDGLIQDTGVHAPESGIIDPELFFSYLSKEIDGSESIIPLITSKKYFLNMESREFKPFGSVSALTLGGGGIGNVWGETSKEESIASVHLALESGIDHLDVAPMYGKGEAERVVGEAIKERSRDSFRLTTKCALGSLPDEEVYDRFNTSLIRSLDTMGTDYVDLFLLHSQLIENDHESQKPDSSFVATGNLTTLKSFYDAVVPAMETLKKEGKILNWGIGPGQEEAVCDVINSTTPPEAIQCGVNVLNSLGAIGYASIKPNPKLVLEESKKKDIPILAIRAVQAGALTSKMDREPHPSGFDHPDFADYEKAQPFRELAEDWGESPASLAHRYALSIDKVGSVILGIKNRQELIECLEAEKKGRLDIEQILTLENLFN